MSRVAAVAFNNLPLTAQLVTLIWMCPLLVTPHGGGDQRDSSGGAGGQARTTCNSCGGSNQLRLQSNGMRRSGFPLAPTGIYCSRDPGPTVGLTQGRVWPCTAVLLAGGAIQPNAVQDVRGARAAAERPEPARSRPRGPASLTTASDNDKCSMGCVLPACWAGQHGCRGLGLKASAP
jgi:hypothetical protein